jgi:hypothetical protein
MNNTEHEEYKQRVLQQFEDEATAKFASTIADVVTDPQKVLNALIDIEAVRGLTRPEKNIKADLVKLIFLKSGTVEEYLRESMLLVIKLTFQEARENFKLSIGTPATDANKIT